MYFAFERDIVQLKRAFRMKFSGKFFLFKFFFLFWSTERANSFRTKIRCLFFVRIQIKRVS